MLLELTVRNIALIEKAHIEFQGGFTVLTGETGAGKSLLIDALELALGNRADSDLVRRESDKGIVNLVADLTKSKNIEVKCEELGIELEDRKLYIQRDILPEGRSIARINGRQVPLSILKQIGEQIVDLCGQHDHQSLLDPHQHLNYLDSWIGTEAIDQILKVKDAHKQYLSAKKELESLQNNQQNREQKIDILKFQINEIKSIDPQEEEYSQLENGVSKLQNAEKLAQSCSQVAQIISDQDNSATEQLAQAIKTLEQCASLDDSINEVLKPLQESYYNLEDAGHAINDYLSNIDSSPDQLEYVVTRLDSLKTLRRKYGVNEAEVIQHLLNSEKELEQLESFESNEAELKKKLEIAKKNLHHEASKLSKTRKQKAKLLNEIIATQLKDLAMPNAVFFIDFTEKEPNASGIDQIEFIFSANKGESAKPLSKIASGGEISRVMLALKVAFAGKAGVPTLIFDEIDTGMSGQTAAKVAAKMKEVAKHYQVLAISHLPQIASVANDHFKIVKSDSHNRTETKLLNLNQEQRVQEIARMLAGEQIGDSALANARELLSTEIITI